MALPSKLSVPGLALLASLSSCAAQEPADDGIGDTVLYEVPQGIFVDRKSTPVDLAIGSEVGLTFKSDPIDPNEMGPVQEKLRSEGRTTIGIKAASDADYGMVVAQLRPIARDNSFELLALEAFRKVENVSDGEAAEVVARGFKGETGETELPVLVGYASESDRCVVVLSDQAVSSEELYDLSFTWLDSIVERAGGVEAIISKPGAVDSLVARVQSTPDTPWRCIGGAIYNISVAGWPYIRLDVVEPSGT